MWIFHWLAVVHITIHRCICSSLSLFLCNGFPRFGDLLSGLLSLFSQFF